MMRKNKLYEKLLEVVNKGCGSMKLMNFSFVIAVMTLSYSAMPATAETNLVANPGFESGTTNPSNWAFVTKNGNTPVWDSTMFYSGSKSVKINIPGTTRLARQD